MLSDILKEVLEAPARTCLVGTWVTEQSEEDQALLQQIFTMPNLVLSDVFRKLSAEGVPFGMTTFKSHIKGTCTCPKA